MSVLVQQMLAQLHSSIINIRWWPSSTWLTVQLREETKQPNMFQIHLSNTRCKLAFEYGNWQKSTTCQRVIQHMWHETHQWVMAHVYGSEILRSAATVLIDRRNKLTNVKLIEVDCIRKCWWCLLQNRVGNKCHSCSLGMKNQILLAAFCSQGFT